MSNTSYKVIDVKILSNEKNSSVFNTIGFNKVYIEIPSLTSFCVQSTTHFIPRIYDPNRGTAALGYYTGLRTFKDFENNIAGSLVLITTPGNLYLELPKSLSGIKSLYIAATNTMTSTCTLRVHVSN